MNKSIRFHAKKHTIHNANSYDRYLGFSGLNPRAELCSLAALARRCCHIR